MYAQAGLCAGDCSLQYYSGSNYNIVKDSKSYRKHLDRRSS